MAVIFRLLLQFMIALSGHSLAFCLADAGIYSYDGFPSVPLPACRMPARFPCMTFSGVQVTDDAIRAALKGSDMQTAQGVVSKPAVENYVRRLEAGEVAPAIKVDGKVIVDGNHRYVAGRLVGKEPAQTAGTLSPSQAGKVQPAENLRVDPSD